MERRQLEAQDGWSAAAQLQQYFRNLHNVLRGSAEQEDEEVGEPSELAELVRSSVVSLKNEYQELREANAKNKDIISLLTRKQNQFVYGSSSFSLCFSILSPVRLSNYEKEEKSGRGNETTGRVSTSEMEYLRDEISVLTIQLKE